MSSRVLPTLNAYKQTFIHPGISITEPQLTFLQKQIKEKHTPWYDYYSAMAESVFGGKDFESANLLANTIDQPQETGLNCRRILDLLILDSYRGYTQILLYGLTGEACYYDNALRLVRIWSHTNPKEMAYFPDAHIHVGWALYYLVSTAELLRTFEAPSESQQTWQPEDSSRLIENFLKPSVDHFYRMPDRYMNQLGYQNVGRMAAALFMDDLPLFEETVEWVTVNKTTTRPLINGAVRFLFQQITPTDPRNPIHKEYVQLMEMGRDSCHAFDDLSVIALLGRMMHHQEANVDPKTGELSAEGVSLYEFDDYAILRGAEQFYRFCYGQSVPWTEFSKDGGSEYPAYVADGVQTIIDYGKEIAQLERGRTRMIHTFSEIYDMHLCHLGWSEEQLAQIAPSLTRAAYSLRQPVYYEGTQKMNFWEVTKDLTPEYWTILPEQRGSQLHLLRQTPDERGRVSFVEDATRLAEDKVTILQEGDYRFLRLTAVPEAGELKETSYDCDFPLDETTVRGGNHCCLPNLDGFGQIVALVVRTTGQGKLLVSGGNNGGRYQASYTEIALPNTFGKWQTIIYDRGSSLQEEIDFYALVASETMTADLLALHTALDCEHLVKATTAITDRIWGIVGNPVSLSFSQNSETNEEQWQLATPSATCELTVNGVLNWAPQVTGEERLLLEIKDDHKRAVYKEICLTAVENPQELKQKLFAEVGPKELFTKESYQTFSELLEQLQKENELSKLPGLAHQIDLAIENLALLNPRLNNGTLAYGDKQGVVAVTSEREEKINLENLTDGDTETIDGNLLSTWICFDFGEGYRIRPTRFGFEARTGFPNRTQGQRVYGSYDGQTWVCLTKEATHLQNHLQWLPVAAELQQAYRYLKVQVDEPGLDTDPAYPGISCRGEFYIDGERLEQVRD